MWGKLSKLRVEPDKDYVTEQKKQFPEELDYVCGRWQEFWLMPFISLQLTKPNPT